MKVDVIGRYMVYSDKSTVDAWENYSYMAFGSFNIKLSITDCVD